VENTGLHLFVFVAGTKTICVHVSDKLVTTVLMWITVS